MAHKDTEERRRYQQGYRLGHLVELKEKSRQRHLLNQDRDNERTKRNWVKSKGKYLKQQRAQQKKWRFLLKMETLTVYSIDDCPICAYCGDNDVRVLQLDHINGGGRRERKELGLTGAGYNFYNKLKKMGFPEGYQVLCANCNVRKRYTEEA